MIYCDTSALVKLVVREAHSRALRDWFREYAGERVVTSVLGHIELVRAAQRADAAVRSDAEALSSRVATLLMTPTVVELARSIGSGQLRTLDAVHLATAYARRTRVVAFCAYDHRLIAAAQACGLPVVSPKDA